MCLIAWNWQPASATPLLLVANRDEFYARPTQALHWWTADGGAHDVLAGRDLQGDGTWLGVSRGGRLAALTNYRSAAPMRADAPTRGALVAAFLGGDLDAATYLQQVALSASNYNPFNLLVWDGHRLMGLESRHAKVISMQPGIGAVSNADFHAPWPKLSGLTGGLQALLDSDCADTDNLLALLQDRHIAPDAALPQTGVPLALERVLSAAFVAAPGYGTRACSVVTIHATHIEFTEQGFGPDGLLGCQSETFTLEQREST